MAVLFPLLNMAAINVYVLYYSDAENQNDREDNFCKNLSLSLTKRDFTERVKKSCFELKRQRFFQNVQKPLKMKEMDPKD
jgi:predicted membrane protein